MATWDVTDPANTKNPSLGAGDIRALKLTLDTALKEFMEWPDYDAGIYLQGYRNNCRVLYKTVATLTVKAGEIAFGSDNKWRQNTTDTTVTWGDLDTGSEETDTMYYVYAVADSGVSTFSVVISKHASTLDAGITDPYIRIGWFFNNADGDIETYGDDDFGTIIHQAGATANDTTTATTYEDMDITMEVVGHGKPVVLTFSGEFQNNTATKSVYVSIDFDGSTVSRSQRGHYFATADKSAIIAVTTAISPATMTAGVHTFKVQWLVDAGTGKAVNQDRVLTYQEG